MDPAPGHQENYFMRSYSTLYTGKSLPVAAIS